MLAEISHGHADLADVLFLVAFVLAVIAGVIMGMAKPRLIDHVLMYATLALLALAFFVL
jgi:ABC-type dipeptide/oligopeptide/nickel transport system permease component